jgi:hypothetical protein
MAEQKYSKSELELSRDSRSGALPANSAAEGLEEPAPARHKPVKRLFATLHNPLPTVEGKAFTNGACKKPRFPLRQPTFP